VTFTLISSRNLDRS